MVSDGGFVSKVYIFLIVIAVLLLVIAGFFAFWAIAPVFVGSITEASNIVHSSLPASEGEGGIGNATMAYQGSISNLESSAHNLEWLGILMLFGLFFAFFIFMWQIKAHPNLFIVWVILCLTMMFASIVISIQYNTILTDPFIANANNINWGLTSTLASSLPLLVAAFFVIGGIILFALSRSSDATGDQTL